MLTRLGESLRGWTPRAPGGDPLATVRGGWAALVGADVARAAQPVAIAGDTLVVITTSSAWSHQLAFLEPQIVRGIREALPGAGIARLRFRVGTIRAKPRSGPSAGGPGTRRFARTSAAAAPPRTASEALARYQASVERVRLAHRGTGGGFCDICAAPIGRGNACAPCTHQAHNELELRCRRLLFEAPWLTAQAVLEMLPGLDADAYDAIRRALLRSWWDEMVLARKRSALPRPIAPARDRLRKIASSFVLLETKMDPMRLELDSAVRRNALGELYEFISALEARPTTARERA